MSFPSFFPPLETQIVACIQSTQAPLTNVIVIALPPYNIKHLVPPDNIKYLVLPASTPPPLQIFNTHPAMQTPQLLQNFNTPPATQTPPPPLIRAKSKPGKILSVEEKQQLKAEFNKPLLERKSDAELVKQFGQEPVSISSQRRIMGINALHPDKIRKETAEDKIKKPHHKRLTLDIRIKYHTQLINREINKEDLKKKGLSYWQISSLQRAEPKPRKPPRRHKPHKPHNKQSVDARIKYRAQLKNGETTREKLKKEGLSDWQISSLQRAEPKRPKPYKPRKRLSLDTRTKYRAQLKSGKITEAELKKDKGLSDWQIKTLRIEEDVTLN